VITKDNKLLNEELMIYLLIVLITGKEVSLQLNNQFYEVLSYTYVIDEYQIN
jgi:hypothetical protein